MFRTLSLLLLLLATAALPARAQAPALTVAAGASYVGQPPAILPFETGHVVRIGDAFAYDVATDWQLGDTRTLTITLDPRLEWTTIGSRACRGDALGPVQVCPEPDAVWVWVRVRAAGDGSPIVTRFAYGDGARDLALPLESRRLFLPLIAREE